MRVALDAMGGDFAPAVTVEGAIETVSTYDHIDVILVGDESVIRKDLERKKVSPERIRIKHASQVILMDESPTVAVRK